MLSTSCVKINSLLSTYRLEARRSPRLQSFSICSPCKMDPEGSSQISFSANGSRLLSESLIETGPGGDDLSISELSLSDHPRTLEKPFSLLAPGVQGHLHTHQGDQEVEEQNVPGLVGRAEGEQRNTSAAREEKLQGDIFVLKKLNASFALFNDALQDTNMANQVAVVLFISQVLSGEWGMFLSVSPYNWNKQMRC